MIRLVSLACALVLCLGATQAPAKEGCGAGLHMNKKGQCVVNKKPHGGKGKACPAHYRKANGQCVPK